MTAMDALPRQNENFQASFQSPGLAAEAAAHLSSRPVESMALASASPSAFKADSPLGTPVAGVDGAAKSGPAGDNRPPTGEGKASAADTTVASAALPGDAKAVVNGTPTPNGDAKAVAGAAVKPTLDSTESNIENSLRQTPSMEGLSQCL